MSNFSQRRNEERKQLENIQKNNNKSDNEPVAKAMVKVVAKRSSKKNNILDGPAIEMLDKYGFYKLKQE